MLSSLRLPAFIPPPHPAPPSRPAPPLRPAPPSFSRLVLPSDWRSPLPLPPSLPSPLSRKGHASLCTGIPVVEGCCRDLLAGQGLWEGGIAYKGMRRACLARSDSGKKKKRGGGITRDSAKKKRNVAVGKVRIDFFFLMSNWSILDAPPSSPFCKLTPSHHILPPPTPPLPPLLTLLLDFLPPPPLPSSFYLSSSPSSPSPLPLLLLPLSSPSPLPNSLDEAIPACHRKLLLGYVEPFT